MNKKTKNFLVLIVLLAVIAIGVGYAALSRTLTLNGNVTTMKAEDWNIVYSGYRVVKGADTVEDFAVNITEGTLKGTFTAKMDLQSDVTFNVNIENRGKTDAKVSKMPVPVIPEALKPYVDCTVNLVNETITDLAEGDAHTYQVRLFYVGDELPEEEINAEIGIEFNYVQK